MKINEYVIVYRPFETSDMTLEALSFGDDEAAALNEFRLLHPTMHVESVKQK